MVRYSDRNKQCPTKNEVMHEHVERLASAAYPFSQGPRRKMEATGGPRRR